MRTDNTSHPEKDQTHRAGITNTIGLVWLGIPQKELKARLLCTTVADLRGSMSATIYWDNHKKQDKYGTTNIAWHGIPVTRTIGRCQGREKHHLSVDMAIGVSQLEIMDMAIGEAHGNQCETMDMAWGGRSLC
jgi:hypothetical protein